MAGSSPRSDRAGETRIAILTAAERLFAEHGVAAVSSRQISDAAGQGNNTAVGYHFGSKANLVRAIARRHAERIDGLRTRMLAEIGDSDDVRDWCACLVRPGTQHLASLPSPTWYARFAAQVMTDPVLRESMLEATFGPSLQRTLDGLNRCLPALPPATRLLRADMARLLMVHSLAERERVLAENAEATGVSWGEHTTALVDALVGLWLAPATPVTPGAPPTPGTPVAPEAPATPGTSPTPATPRTATTGGRPDAGLGCPA